MDVMEHQRLADAFQEILDRLVAAYGWDAAMMDCFDRFKSIEDQMQRMLERITTLEGERR